MAFLAGFGCLAAVLQPASGDRSAVVQALEEAHRALGGRLQTTGSLEERLTALADTPDALGPRSVVCSAVDGKGAYDQLYSERFDDFPERVADLDGSDHSRVVVPIRSISKVFMTAAFLQLQDLLREDNSVKLQAAKAAASWPATSNNDFAMWRRLLRLNVTVAEVVPSCKDSALGSATLLQAFTMRTALDNRLNAAWKLTKGMMDHAGFPPYCDDKGLSAKACLETVLCPAYPAKDSSARWSSLAEELQQVLPEEMRKAAATARLKECKDDNTWCAEQAAFGECAMNPGYMPKHCSKACGSCVSERCHGWRVSREDEAASKEMNRLWKLTKHPRAGGCTDASPKCRKQQCNRDPMGMRKNCRRTCGWCDDASPLGFKAGETGPAVLDQPVNDTKAEASVCANGWWTFVEADDGPGYLEYAYTSLCRYDNYAYGLADGVIQSVTGAPLWQWVLTLVAEPAGLDDMVRCMTPPPSGTSRSSTSGCFARLSSASQMFDTSSWPAWRSGGPESANFVGTSLYASSRDMTRFGAMLLNAGWSGGQQVLSRRTAQLLLKGGRPDPDETVNDLALDGCQGFTQFGLGLGYCSRPYQPRNEERCHTLGWWGFGSTYGSRIFIMPTPRSAGGKSAGGLACSLSANVASEGEPKTSAGAEVRVASRQHAVAHSQAEKVKAVLESSAWKAYAGSRSSGARGDNQEL
eukprot:TRINITY_DN12770_c0_g1_i2.p1 TRINITY_DN12770_c0_g1~~TRINITY_DN12770_c0_g1_i2.p1  ORF type:complete len:696 (+),score=129.41 TRINITY_DN12770_c0_g1_i2:652-2739(+)